MVLIGLWISVIMLGLGTLLGLKGWLDPQWGARLVRLQARPDQPEGITEFRGTFGGMFAGLHLAALVLVHLEGPAVQNAVCWVLAAGWWGTALARTHSVLVDPGANHPFPRFSIGLELVVGLLIAALPLARLIAG
jgi:hypothetical protein